MKKLFFGIVFLALILRLLIFFAIINNNPDNFRQPDSGGYLQLADNFLSARVFSSSPGYPYAPEYNRTPAYPLFLSLLKSFGAGIKSMIFFQIIISLASIALVMYFCGAILRLSTNAVAFAGALLALDIPSIVLANSMLTETLFTFLLLCGAYFLTKHLAAENFPALALSAVFFGSCSLCRPVAFALPVFIVVSLLLLKVHVTTQGLYSAIIFLLIYVLSLSPLLIRNNNVFGGPFLSTISYDNLLFVQAAGVESVVNKIPLQEARENLMKMFDAKYSAEISSGDLLKIKKLEGREAAKIISAYPVQFTMNFTRSIFNMLFRPIRNDLDLMIGFKGNHNTLESWGGTQSKTFLTRLFESTSSFTVALCVFQFILLLLTYFFVPSGALTGLTMNRPFIAVTLSVIVYFCLMSGAPETYARFRVPIMPFFAILSAIGFERLTLKNNRRIVT